MYLRVISHQKTETRFLNVAVSSKFLYKISSAEAQGILKAKKKKPDFVSSVISVKQILLNDTMKNSSSV